MTPTERLDGILTTVELAGLALKRLPREKMPAPLRAAWPQAPYEWWAYNTEDKTRIVRDGPTREQVTALDELVDWLWILTERERRVVLARSLGLSWRRIVKLERKFGRGLSHEGWRNVYHGALAKIAEKGA